MSNLFFPKLANYAAYGHPDAYYSNNVANNALYKAANNDEREAVACQLTRS